MFHSCKINRGAAGQQYAIIVGLIAVIGISAVAYLGSNIKGLFAKTSNVLGSVSNTTAANGGGGGGGGGGTGPFTFTNCGKTGNAGPAAGDCTSAYGATSLAGLVTVNSGYQLFSIPTSGVWRIEAWGAQGGYGSLYVSSGGLGAYAKGEISLTAGTQLLLLVGQLGGVANEDGGGGGGTFVTQGNDKTTSTILIAAGGGGAHGSSGGAGAWNAGSATQSGQTGANNGTGGTSGNGAPVGGNGWGGPGAGFLTNGADAGVYSGQSFAFRTTGLGAPAVGCGGSQYASAGGFGGGGGGGCAGGGGGGGYSGGGSGGGGGGSFVSGANTATTGGVRSGHGQVVLTYVSP